MKLLAVIGKSYREQVRSFWILFLTISMAPFFVGVYYLILESYQPKYEILVLNHDNGVNDSSGAENHGQMLIKNIEALLAISSDLPFTVEKTETKEMAIGLLKNRKADALIVIPENFSAQLYNCWADSNLKPIHIEFIGDLTNMEYMISAVWANAAVNQYVDYIMEGTQLLNISETSLGLSGSITEFDMMVPGLLILSLIMLMFSASIAIVSEVENKTILRLKLSKVSTLEFLAGAGVVQVLVGLISIVLTLVVAIAAGFSHYAALGMLFGIAVLTSLSIFAFSLILAALTKSVNEILIVGNFPLFLFMFFTGAAFPLEGKAMFSIAGYPVTFQGLMSPTHAIAALKKVMILDMQFKDIIPEVVAIILLTAFYFAIGVWAFKKRHMRVV